MATSVATSGSKSGELFGHPKGLFVLFFAEMWERMSYYGMRALLVLYMTQYLMVDPERAANVTGFNALKGLLEQGFGPLENQPYASHIYGLYTGFAYLTPFFGGILADRVWGKRKSVYVGGALMAIGHMLMGVESMFLLALFFLILGNGAFKPNISTQVGALYPQGDPRRDGAFTIFYMGINLGAFFSPFLCKNLAVYIAQSMGRTDEGFAWHLGFTLAGFGMMLGLLVYHFGRKYLPKEDLTNLAPPEKRQGMLWKNVGGMLGFMALFMLVLMLPMILKVLIIGAVIASVVIAIRKIEDASDRARVSALTILCCGTIAFWAIFEQQGNTLQIWADEKADWGRLGLQAENYQSLNPLYIFLFAPLLNIYWDMRAAKGKRSSSVRKMGIGCILAGIAFAVIPLASNFITIDKSLTNMFWLALTTWIFTMGELYLSPIGLSLVTKVSPARFVSMMMGVWFVSSFIGNYMAGLLGTLYSTLSQSAFFMVFAVLGGVVGLFFFGAEKKLQKVIGDI